LKILLLHNHYRYRGGEDIAVEQDFALLREHGHDVRLLLEHNESISGVAGAVSAACSAVYSVRSRRRVADELRAFRPDVVHVHNFFPLLSPSVYLACSKASVPVLQTLHNYRLICPGTNLFRDGRPCEDCVGRSVPWPGVLHGCYRGSRAGTAAVAAMVGIHNALNTWSHAVDAYIALTEFARRKLIAGGLPAEKFHVKPNFVTPDPGAGPGDAGYALFVGRLSEGKGIDVLLEAWKLLETKIPLVIVGEGPMASKVALAARTIDADYRGLLSRPEVTECMRRASLLVFPSVWYEAFPLVIAEALACGLPVLVSDAGSAADLIDNGRTGLHFHSGDPKDLAAKVEFLWREQRLLGRMRKDARAEYERHYNSERNYARLMQIYGQVLDQKKEAGGAKERWAPVALENKACEEVRSNRGNCGGLVELGPGHDCDLLATTQSASQRRVPGTRGEEK
jgi:glycosyltransferase involved in cell wall biosynthesis